MSNTHARICRIQETDDFGGHKHETSMELTLTAFVGGDRHTQLTVQTNSTLPFQSGTGYITLSDEDVDLLIAALLERKLGKVSATGNEQSIFCPNDDRRCCDE